MLSDYDTHQRERCQCGHPRRDHPVRPTMLPGTPGCLGVCDYGADCECPRFRFAVELPAAASVLDELWPTSDEVEGELEEELLAVAVRVCPNCGHPLSLHEADGRCMADDENAADDLLCECTSTRTAGLPPWAPEPDNAFPVETHFAHDDPTRQEEELLDLDGETPDDRRAIIAMVGHRAWMAQPREHRTERFLRRQAGLPPRDAIVLARCDRCGLPFRVEIPSGEWRAIGELCTCTTRPTLVTVSWGAHATGIEERPYPAGDPILAAKRRAAVLHPIVSDDAARWPDMVADLLAAGIDR